jgi:hypothetical protein
MRLTKPHFYALQNMIVKKLAKNMFSNRFTQNNYKRDAALKTAYFGFTAYYHQKFTTKHVAELRTNVMQLAYAQKAA